MGKRVYRVWGKFFTLLSDAKEAATEYMTGQPEGSGIDIYAKEREDPNFALYGRMVREKGRVVLKR